MGSRKKFKSIQLKRKELELEMKAGEDDIAKSNIQLTQLKTNKEYQIKLNEIASIKADKSIIEEKILLSYDAADAVRRRSGRKKCPSGLKRSSIWRGKKRSKMTSG